MRVRVRARDVVKVVMLCGLIAELTLAPVAQARPSPAFAARDAVGPRLPLGAATASPSGTTAATAPATISATATSTTTATVSASATVTATGTVTSSLSPTATVSGTPMGRPSVPALPDATLPATTTLVVTATSAASAPSATAPALPSLTPTITGEPVSSTVATLNAVAGLTATENAYGHLPLSFEPNQGQAGPGGGDVQFLSHGPGFTLFLTGADATLVLRQPHVHASGHPFEPGLGHDLLHTDTLTQTDAFSASVVRLRYEGAHANPQVVGENQLPGIVNYFIGNDSRKWETGIPTFAKVSYGNMYPDIALVYYGHVGQLEYDWQVAPGADRGAISVSVEGARGANLDADGNLVLQTAVGTVAQHAPLAYQEINGQRRIVPARYVLATGGRVSFAVSDYDKNKPLVIDPVLSYSTYLGGSGDDYGYGIAVDAAGAAYITGYTHSTNFPTGVTLLKHRCKEDMTPSWPRS